jgi:iron complex transport system permease protein
MGSEIKAGKSFSYKDMRFIRGFSYPTFIFFALLLFFSVLSLFIAPWVGSSLSIREAIFFGSDSSDFTIFWQLRLPRVLLAYLAGGVLSLCGMCFQGLFRNSLATPYTLGVSSGASLGVAIYIFISKYFILPALFNASTAAFLGAAGTIILVYGLTSLRGQLSPAIMLLAGVAVSFFFSSLIMFFQYLSDYTELQQLMRWLMGSLQTIGYYEVRKLFFLCIIPMFLVLWQVDALNLLAIGEEFAISRGVESGKVRKIFFFSVSLMVAAVVSICGPIGFVGMICPHICRLFVGDNHRVLAPASIMFGGIFLLICDTVARTILAPVELPSGIITALLGGPFFLWLLFRRRRD